MRLKTADEAWWQIMKWKTTDAVEAEEEERDTLYADAVLDDDHRPKASKKGLQTGKGKAALAEEEEDVFSPKRLRSHGDKRE